MPRIVGTNTEPSLELSSIYEVYYKSKEFKHSLLKVLKLDEIYSTHPDILNLFRKIFDGENLESKEFSLVKRVFSDSCFMESLSQTLSEEDFEMFFSYIKKSSNLGLANGFYYPSSSFKKENKIVVITYIVGEFLGAIKNSYVSNLMNQTTTQVEGIIGEYAGEEIELIKQAKKYSLVKVGDVYKLYDNENKKISSEYMVIKNDIIELQNGDISMVVTPKDSIFEELVISLETGKKLTPIFQIGYDIEKKDDKTIIFLRMDSTLNKLPYCLETQEFLNIEEYPIPVSQHRDFLSQEEVNALLTGVASEEDDWAAAINIFSKQQQGQGDVLDDLATPVLDEIERELQFHKDPECNGEANPEDIKII